MKAWRFIDSRTLPAVLNMAIDEAILAMHVEGQSPPTLRIYQWSPPAISLGYFQRRHGIDLVSCERQGIDVVRRLTGGRAVLHYQDLTYAVVAGTSDGLPSSAAGAYRLICEGLLTAFRTLGLEAELGHQDVIVPRSDICFLTSTTGDILHKGRKLVGSAQTWRCSSMLQHGSITLEPHVDVWANIQKDTSMARTDYEEMLKQRMTSIQEILGYIPETGEISRAIQDGMSRAFHMELKAGQLTPEELTLVQTVASRCAHEVANCGK